jgi:glucokinase
MPNPKPRAKSPKSRGRAGRNGRPLFLGIDLGATKVVGALVDSTGAIVRRSDRLHHQNDGPRGVLDILLDAAQQCLDGGAEVPRGVGIAVAAQVDPDRGEVVYSPNLGWRGQPVGAPIARALGLPVSVVNDARAATLAEWRFGAGVGEKNLFCLVLGTGVGGSVVVDGVLQEGGNHAAGEVGHITVVSQGRQCHCPNRGCFEAYVGGWAIADRSREAVANDPSQGRRLVRRAGSPGSISAETVFRAARAHDPLARRIVAETEQILADGAVSVVNAFNPATLVLAGGLIAGRPEWVRVVARAVRARCQPAAAKVRVVGAALGEDAGVVGAAEWARARSAFAR